MHRILHTGSFIVLFSGILHTISVFPGNHLLNCGDLCTTLVEWFINSGDLLERALTLRLLMSYIYIYIYIYIYGEPILDVSRSHTTTQHSR